jgi:hypothetical protein
MSSKTIARGRKELLSHHITPDRIRQEGAGQPTLKKTDLLKKIEELMAEDTAGDPMSGRKWTRKSTYTVSEELCAEDISLSPNIAGKLLKELHFSLKSNRKTIAETHHPARNQQFGIIADMKMRFTDRAQPVVSVDSKKKELIGNFKNNGKTWKKKREEVYCHDFRSMATGIANPYGRYDLTANCGTVVVGTSYDTPEFAAESIELWLTSSGYAEYPHMDELLILCDAGGSNSYRARLWKYGLSTKICRPYGISVIIPRELPNGIPLTIAFSASSA